MGNLATEAALPHLAKEGLETGVRLEVLPELASQASRLRTIYGT